ncbi:MAG: radical SAM family heme chaperone HemW [Gammaproteobacteria bacterium]
MFSFDTPPPLSLYVHLPWCVRKCPYCDFNSYARRDEALPESGYLKALLKDMEHEAATASEREIQTIFIGGGTPSLFSAEAIGAVLGAARSKLSLASDVEITLEANPGCAEAARFAAYRDAGVNRLSIGVQSFNDVHLRVLGRIHSAADAVRAVEAATTAGFDNFNIDLMYGLPGQTASQAQADLSAATELAPDHISYYQLTIEPNTAFHATPPKLPDDDAIWEMHEQGHELLGARGYEQYEVSAFAKTSRRCRHNLNYWSFGDYIGIGAGAHGKITNTQEQTITRYWKHRQPAQYMRTAQAGAASGERRSLSMSDTAFEFMLNRLRLSEGFDADEFAASTGLCMDSMATPLKQAVERGLLRADDEQFHTTALGRRFLNDLTAMFLPVAEAESANGTAL